MKYKLLVLSGLVVNLAFANNPITKAVTTKSSCVVGNRRSASDYQAVKWYQVSAERKALFSQVYEMSKPVLAANRRKLAKGEACGVILDIDETVLNNSAYAEVNDAKCGSWSYASWNKFVDSKVSKPLIGAASLTHYVHDTLGCSVNLVSNRLNTTLKATKELLKDSGIYFDQVLLSANEKDRDKNPRFKAIIAGTSPSTIKHKQVIIGYYGDNIQDFPNSKQSQYNDDSSKYKLFGKKYFILPNPMYGSWLAKNYNP